MAEAFAEAPLATVPVREAVVLSFSKPELESAVPDLAQPLGESAVDGFERVSTLASIALEPLTTITDGGSWDTGAVADQPEPAVSTLSRRSSRKPRALTLVVGAAAGIFSLSATTPVAADTPPPSPSPTPTSGTSSFTPAGGPPTASGTKTLHRKSSITSQYLLNHIHHVARPSDEWRPGRHYTVQPTSAYMRPSAIGFRTNCDEFSSFRHYDLDQSGLSYKTCGPLAVEPTSAEKNQFRAAGNRLGDKTAAAVGMATSETVRSMGGKRSAVNVRFNYDPSVKGSIVSVTVYKSKSQPASIVVTK